MEILSVVIFVLFVLTVLGLSWYFARRSKSASGYFAAGGIMAANPKWCLSISEWKKHFADWILDASPESILEVNVFFDIHCAYGDQKIASELQMYMLELCECFIKNIRLPDKAQLRLFRRGRILIF